MKFKIILSISLMIFCDLFLFSQTDNGNSLLIKYWHYRNRLKYFVVNNENSDPNEKGIANVSPNRNRDIEGGILTTDFLTFGQQTSSMGYYIGVLATEYKLLKDAGINNEAQKTLEELYRALLSLKRLDLCESGYPWGVSYGGSHSVDIWDGYLNRNDVPWNFLQVNNSVHSNELNEDLDPTITDPKLTPGYPTWVNNISSFDPQCPDRLLENYDFMAQGQLSWDEINKIYIGLALVKKCIPSSETEIYDLNFQIAKRIYMHLATNFFILKNPDGDPVDAGADANLYSGGLYGSAMYICDQDNDIFWHQPTVFQQTLWNQYQDANTIINTSTEHKICTFAAIADNWSINIFPFPIINTTGMGINNLAAHKNWETFYLSLWKFLHDKNSYDDIENKVNDQLVAAPCEGPYKFNTFHAGGGWATSFKFQMPTIEQNEGESNGFGGNYAGLDYMLLYNLYLLTFGSGTYYADLLNREISGHCPNRINSTNGNLPGTVYYYYSESDAFKKLISNQIISNLAEIWEHQVHVEGPDHQVHVTYEYLGSEPWTGCVTYTAGKEIHLKPGFHVLPGATFHGYIRKQLCDLTSGTKTTTTPYCTELWDLGGYKLKPSFTEIEEKAYQIIDTVESSKFQSINNINIFPNPFIDCFYFTNNTKEIAYFELSDISSKIILKGTLNNENCFQNIPSGLYLLKIYLQDCVKIIKLIKS